MLLPHHTTPLLQVHLNKARLTGKEDKLALLQTRIAQVDAFVSARKMVKTEPETMVRMPMLTARLPVTTAPAPYGCR